MVALRSKEESISISRHEIGWGIFVKILASDVSVPVRLVLFIWPSALSRVLNRLVQVRFHPRLLVNLLRGDV